MTICIRPTVAGWKHSILNRPYYRILWINITLFLLGSS